jgi:hypothetical protein
VTRIVALDWSGVKRGGGRRTIWSAQAADGRLTALFNGRKREEVAEDLIELAKESPDLVIGLDFAFSMPEWFVREKGAASGRDFWAIAAKDGDDWLKSCEVPFWGRKGKKRPLDVCLFRRTEEQSKGPGSEPKSVFQINGGGSVGTGSIRGMPILLRLFEAGFRIWPFEEYVPGKPLVVEIYPRLLTEQVVKSSDEERAAYLKKFANQIAPDLLAKAAASEDAFDAAISALKMDQFRGDFLNLPVGDALDKIEGRIWKPAGASS